jgi:hypothetical protein
VRRAVTAILAAAFALPVLAVMAGPGGAQEVERVTTSIKEQDCKVVDRGEPPETWVVRGCPGKFGNVVRIAIDDLRATLSIGPTQEAAAEEPAATQFFSVFSATGNVVEWRREKGGAPIAALNIWKLGGEETGRGVIVAVTRLPPGQVCHVAYVDVVANADAVDLARAAADSGARNFRCGRDQVKIVGKRGLGVRLATQ